MSRAQTKEQVQALLAEGVVDISAGFPATNPTSYLELAYELFKAGVYRVPIIGIKATEQITSLALFTSEIQEHHELAKIGQIRPEQMVYTASLEGFPFTERDYIFAYLQFVVGENTHYQRLGRGSDYYPVQLSSLGVTELTRLFSQIGTLTNV